MSLLIVSYILLIVNKLKQLTQTPISHSDISWKMCPSFNHGLNCLISRVEQCLANGDIRCANEKYIMAKRIRNPRLGLRNGIRSLLIRMCKDRLKATSYPYSMRFGSLDL